MNDKICSKDVIKMRIPFPNVESGLVTQRHMYVCLKDDEEFLACTTMKPEKLKKNVPPYNYVKERPDIDRNPFEHSTLIECDHSFLLSNVMFDDIMRTEKRKDVCDDVFNKIKSTINHPGFSKMFIEMKTFFELNTAAHDKM